MAQHAEMLDLWRRSLLKTAVLFFPIFVFLEVTARPFITILFTEQYADATPVFMVYMLIFLRSTVETGAIIQVFNRTMFVVVGFFVGFVFNVALGLLLLKTMGRLGVPLATLITMTAISIVNLWYSGTLVGASFLQLLPVRELLKRFLAAAVPGAALWLFHRRYPIDNIFELAAAGLSYCALYGALCWLTRLITSDDVKSLFGRNPV